MDLALNACGVNDNWFGKCIVGKMENVAYLDFWRHSWIETNPLYVLFSALFDNR